MISDIHLKGLKSTFASLPAAKLPRGRDEVALRSDRRQRFTVIRAPAATEGVRAAEGCGRQGPGSRTRPLAGAVVGRSGLSARGRPPAPGLGKWVTIWQKQQTGARQPPHPAARSGSYAPTSPSPAPAPTRLLRAAALPGRK